MNLPQQRPLKRNPQHSALVGAAKIDQATYELCATIAVQTQTDMSLYSGAAIALRTALLWQRWMARTCCI
jgi:hypothetical protein